MLGLSTTEMGLRPDTWAGFDRCEWQSGRAMGRFDRLVVTPKVVMQPNEFERLR